MKKVNVHEAKTHLSRLLDRVSAGEEIIICKAGKPVARFVPLEAADTIGRKPGLLKGKIYISPNFDVPLPDDLLSAFEYQTG